ncbi:MAG: ester cyclase [Chloroflexi bacterium]|nr:ester cyclase [Chloroflexota bacterium]
MSEQNKAVARRWYQELNKHNLAVVDEIASPNIVDHSAPPGIPPGKEGVKQVLSMFFAAFPDMNMDSQDLIAEGDRVVSRNMVRGTHKGAFMGIPATGKKFEVAHIDILRIVGGKLVEHWMVLDEAGLMRQLGLMPGPGQTGR